MRRLNYFLFTGLIFSLLFIAACRRIAVKNPLQPDINFDWPQFGLDPQHTGYRPVNMTPPFKLIWDRGTTSTPGPSLVATRGVVLFGTYEGDVAGFNVNTGKKAGFITVRGSEERSIAVYGDNIFIVRKIGQPKFELYNINRGKNVWKSKGKIILQEPLLVNNKAYISDVEGKLICLSLEDGREDWSIDLYAQSHTTPAYYNELVVVGDDMGNIYAIDHFPQIIWKYPTSGALRAAPVISSETVYIGSTNSNFYAIHLADGKEKWIHRIRGKIYHPAAVNNNSVIFGATDHKVYCLDKHTGEEKWTFEANSVISTAPVITNKIVFIGSLDHFIYALDLESGEKL